MKVVLRLSAHCYTIFSMKVLILLSLCFASLNAFAFKVAVVNVPETVVYSDLAMTSAIGFIRGGKVLKVGEKARMKGTLVTIVVSGRVAYVQSKDLRYVKDENKTYSPKITEHNIDNDIFKVDDSLKNNNHLVIQGGQFSLGDNWSNVSTAAGDSSVSAMTYYSVMLEHRSPLKSYGFGLGGSFYKVTQQNVEAAALSLDGQFYYSPIKFSWVSIDLLFGGMLSFDTRVKVSEVTGVTKGTFYGWRFGPQARIFPEKKIGFVVGFGYKRITVSSVKRIVLADNTEVSLDLLSGTHAYGGMSYRF
jgi:hypothetical protein